MPLECRRTENTSCESSSLGPASCTSQDARFQNALVASLVAMSRATELGLKESKGNKELVTCMTDAIALAIQGCHA